MDPEFEAEMLDVFLEEFEDLMVLLQGGMKELQKLKPDREQAYKDIFRVFHTLKGDAGFFAEFAPFTKWAAGLCEIVRDITEDQYDDPEIYNQMRLAYARLSSAFGALNRGKSLRTFRFKIFLRNF